jgi:hypothetical protein
MFDALKWTLRFEAVICMSVGVRSGGWFFFSVVIVGSHLGGLDRSIPLAMELFVV